MRDWDNLEELDGDRMLAELREPAEAVVLRAVQLFQREWVATLSGPRSGRAYQIGGRIHIASAPGEPPAVLFGRLRQSIAYTMPEWDGLTVSASVGTNVIYARRLEWGGIDSRGVRILPRPHAEPTSLRVEPMIEALFEKFAA